MRRAAVMGALLTALAAGRANAYVRSVTAAGNPFYWKESCVPITIYLHGFDGMSGMSASAVIKSVTAAAHTWSSDAVSCTNAGVTTNPYLEIVPTVASATATPPPAAWDAKNSIIFRTDMWSKSGERGMGYAAEALAVTTVTTRLDGHIVDTDMEINGVTKTWMNLDPGVSVPVNHGLGDDSVFDLQNALTHEFGHFIGLAHTCFDPTTSTSSVWPTDDAGNKVPDCNAANLPLGVENAVMFPSAVPGETSKRTLAPDDIMAVCEIYAPANATQACALDAASPGCAVAAARPSRPTGSGRVLGLSAVALLAGVVVARQRARRARRW